MRNKQKIAEYNKQYHIRNRQKVISRVIKWQLDHPDRVKAIRDKGRIKHRTQYKEWRKKYLEMFPDKQREYGKKTRETLRAKVLEILGNKCVRCGFSDIRALQFDHINGDGYIDNHRSRKGAGKILREYRDNPELTKKRLQILCANCNQVKKHMKNENWRHPVVA